MCLDHSVPLEVGDHSACTIELLDCPAHRNVQISASGGVADIPAEEGWVPLQVPNNMEEMFQAWQDDHEPSIGWCLLCHSPVRTETDLIPETNTHNCASGRALEAKIAEIEAARRSGGGVG